MNKRRIGTSNLYVSEIGLGCMSIGTDERHATHIIDSALDLGINYLDTADLYDQGLNEEFVGKTIKGKRQNIILATKVGNRLEKGKEGWTWDPSKAHIKEAVKESLMRLQTDYIDLYQLHGGTMEDHIDDTIEAFEELKEEGVIRYYGISSIRPNVIREYVNRSSIISVMMQYSILDRRPEEQVYSFLKEHNVSVVARGPVAKGLLTDRLSDNHNDYLEYSVDELKHIIPLLKEKVAPGRPLTELALRYCLHEDVVASVVVGASKLEQLQRNVEAVTSKPLTELEIQEIRSITKASVYKQHR
ncbi:aldo/keto reductase [Ferdinandcohnia quinoae]|uniref:Aldo/keto reductase n=1 Tax=Fredinandcohnia quinoae TaxID=2918902 RepID=A0AAW5E7R9_9BACI|nr:aldo/keto reductase [Fredinandcohnia sp. SECRCQ15]